jgi:hypothetical protein
VMLLLWPFDPRLDVSPLAKPGSQYSLEGQLKAKPPTQQKRVAVSRLLPLEEVQRQVAEKLWPVRKPWLGLVPDRKEATSCSQPSQ